MSYIIDLRNSLKDEKKHMPIIQVGAAIIVVEGTKILLQKRSDNNEWGLPGGVQDLEETVQENAVRELFEETNLMVREGALELFNVFSGKSRYARYPNGDEVYNNTTVFIVREFSGNLKHDFESKELKFFDINNLPKELFKTDKPIIDEYIRHVNTD